MKRLGGGGRLKRYESAGFVTELVMNGNVEGIIKQIGKAYVW